MLYITKKRAKFRTINAIDVNLPYGTICEQRGNYLYNKNTVLCTTRSQNFHDFFWPYDESKPDGGIEMMRLYDELSTMSPIDNEAYNNDEAVKVWLQFGELEDLGVGLRFHWNDSLKDTSPEYIKMIMDCLKNNTLPINILQ